MSLKQKAIKGVFWSVIQKWGSNLISTLVFLILARLLEAEAFGLVAMASVAISFLQIFLDQGFAEAIVQREEVETKHLDTAFWISFSISIFLAAVTIVVAGIIAALFEEPQLVPILRVLSLSFLCSGLNSVQTALLQRQLRFKVLAMRTVIGNLFGGIVGVAMALMGFGVWSLVIKQLVDSFSSVPLLWFSSKWRPGTQVSLNHFYELFSFGINVTGISFLNFLNRRADDLLIGYYLGSVALGYYSVAYRLLLLVIQVVTSVISQVTLPTFSKLQAEPERIRRAFYKVTQYTSLVSFPIFFGMAVLAPEFIVGVFGEQWLPSIPVMQILAFMGVLQSVQIFNGRVIVAMGKPDWQLQIYLLNAVVNVVSFLLVVKWGITAVAAAYTIRGYLFSPISILLVKKLINIKFGNYWRQYLIPLIGSFSMVIVIFAIKQIINQTISELLIITICTIVGSLLYGVIIVLFAPKVIQEIYSLIRTSLPAKTQ